MCDNMNASKQSSDALRIINRIRYGVALAIVFERNIYRTLIFPSLHKHIDTRKVRKGKLIKGVLLCKNRMAMAIGVINDKSAKYFRPHIVHFVRNFFGLVFSFICSISCSKFYLPLYLSHPFQIPLYFSLNYCIL